MQDRAGRREGVLYQILSNGFWVLQTTIFYLQWMPRSKSVLCVYIFINVKLGYAVGYSAAIAEAASQCANRGS
jgi:hypothetical protein